MTFSHNGFQKAYNEVCIMEQLRGLPGIAELQDYGVGPQALCLVLRRYRCSLKDWRRQHAPAGLNPASLQLYLNVFVQVRDGRRGCHHPDKKAQRQCLLTPRNGHDCCFFQLY